MRLRNIYLLLAALVLIPGLLRAQEAPAADTIVHDCNYSFNLGSAYVYSSPPHYALGYDTLKAFVERCPTNQYAPGAFGNMSGAVQYGGNGPSPQCWIDFRHWLLSALPWNTHSQQYFCADVETIAGTFSNGPEDSTALLSLENTNKSLAVAQWLIQNPMCDNATMRELYVNSRGSQKAAWLSTQDTSVVKLDTTLPTMHDLGLDSVLKYATLLGVHSGHTETILSAATAYPNPVGDVTVISFSNSREAYVKIEVLDVLGNVMPTSSFEGVVEAGTHKVPIVLRNLSRGNYFARIVTTYGEILTVKLVKE